MICTKDIVRLDHINTTSMDLDDAIAANKQKNANSLILENGKQLLQYAREGDSRGVVELLGKGAPITTDWLGTSPLHLAVMNNHYETSEVLLRAGVSKDGRTKVDRTPLHFAAYDGYYHIAKLLLRHGADIDCRDMLQMTPLHWAVERGHKECVKVLLSSGAKSDAVSRFNKTPLSIALEMNWVEVVQMLQKSSLLEATQSLNAEYDEMKEAVHKLTNEFDHVPLKLTNDKSSDSTVLNDLETDSIDVEKDVQNVFASLLPQVDESPNEATLQLLKEHGIMMLPTDSTNTVNSAIQSGRKVVLSDAGKLVLKDVNFQKDPPKPIEIKRKPIILPSTKMKSAKIYTVTSSQFIAMTGGKPNILQKMPETLKTSPYVQLQKNINVSPVKITPYSSNIKIVNNSMPSVKAVPDTVVKMSNPLLNSPPTITTIKGDIVKINQLKNSRIIKYNNSNANLSKPVKIVIKKNSIAKQISNLPDSISRVLNCDTTNVKEISAEDVTTGPLENFALNDRISLSNNNSNEIGRLKSELTLARVEIDYYKKKYEETLAELILYKNKLNCHSLMELETNSID